MFPNHERPGIQYVHRNECYKKTKCTWVPMPFAAAVSVAVV
jgi:hypothetical protein